MMRNYLLLNRSKITIRGEIRFEKVPIISMAQARNDILKGGAAFIAYVSQHITEKQEINDVEIVRVNLEVFPE